MAVMVYLYFTLLSIFLQFCIMDLLEINIHSEANVTNIEGHPLKKLIAEPHALFYKVNENDLRQNIEKLPKYNNSSLPVTPFYEKDYYGSSTMYDVFFEENLTASTETTEVYISTDYPNVTEFEVFPKTNSTKFIPKMKPKKFKDNNCFCDLLYYSCDIDCCCDTDCSAEELHVFDKCLDENLYSHSEPENICYNNKSRHIALKNLFCNIKTNVPKKKNIRTYDENQDTDVNIVKMKSYSWLGNEVVTEANFIGKMYVEGDPVWLLLKNLTSIIDLPSPQYNSYCTGRKQIRFLRDESYECLVKLQDLEMFKIYKHIEDSKVISVYTEKWIDTSLNCSKLYCSKWNVIICDGVTCNNYNKTLHEPVCTETSCTNLALKVEYVFHSHASNITNSSIYLHIKDMPMKNQLFNQEISVKFYLVNENMTGELVQLSGNRGYLKSYPIIASFLSENHTEDFKNSSNMHNIRYPLNLNGACFISDIKYNKVIFKMNSKNKCNFYMKTLTQGNATGICEDIQKKIFVLLGSGNGPFIAPIGNPFNVNDKEWLELKYNVVRNGSLYGAYSDDKSALTCYNLVTILSYMFTYADVTSDNVPVYKIMDAKAYLTSQRQIFFNVEDASTVITTDITFYDVTKPPIYQYAGAPTLHVRLPDDFFYPFTYNSSNKINLNVYVLVIILINLIK